MAEQLNPGHYYGSIAGKRISGRVLLSELVHKTARPLPTHAHGHPYVSLLASGSYRERWGRNEIWYNPFTTVYHPEGFCHDDEIGPGGARFFSIEIPRADFEAGGLRTPEDVIRDTTHGRLSQAAVRLFTAHRLGDALEIPIAEFLSETVAPAARTTDTTRPGWLARVNAMLHELTAEPLTLNQLAAAAGVHPVHVSRTFERYEGCTVSERLRSLRVQQAMRAIAHSDSTLAEAAASSGFTDQSHLTRVFRQELGITPGRFRAAVRPGLS